MNVSLKSPPRPTTQLRISTGSDLVLFGSVTSSASSSPEQKTGSQDDFTIRYSPAHSLLSDCEPNQVSPNGSPVRAKEAPELRLTPRERGVLVIDTEIGRRLFNDSETSPTSGSVSSKSSDLRSIPSPVVKGQTLKEIMCQQNLLRIKSATPAKRLREEIPAGKENRTPISVRRGRPPLSSGKKPLPLIFEGLQISGTPLRA